MKIFIIVINVYISVMNNNIRIIPVYKMAISPDLFSLLTDIFSTFADDIEVSNYLFEYMRNFLIFRLINNFIL